MSGSNEHNIGFYTMITGQVESCQMQGAEHLYCRYGFNYGADWSYTHGVEKGMSQIAVNASGKDQLFVWNYPIDCTFYSTNVFGWPQLVVSVYGMNIFAEDVIQGYGCTHIPTVPGRHVRYVRLYTPVSSSLCQQFTSWMTCTPPEFFETKFIAQGKGREVTRVQSKGVLKIVINVTTKNMREWGYDVVGERDAMRPKKTPADLSTGPGDWRRGASLNKRALSSRLDDDLSARRRGSGGGGNNDYSRTYDEKYGDASGGSDLFSQKRGADRDEPSYSKANRGVADFKASTFDATPKGGGRGGDDMLRKAKSMGSGLDSARSRGERNDADVFSRPASERQPRDRGRGR
jgi:B9 domain-containing protein 1